MKYILFKNNEYFRLASTDAKKDNWIKIEPGVVAKQVSDEDFKAVAFGKKTPYLSGDSVSWTIGDLSANGINDEPITDAAVIQEKLTNEIEIIKTSIKNLKLTENPEVQSLTNFLNTIDVTTKTTGSTLENLREYIYNLENCPQVFLDDITY